MNIFTAKKFETKIKSVITVSKIYSITEISRITNINETDTVELIEKMIKKGNVNNVDYRQFKNGHIDYRKNEIVLDETKQFGITDRLGKMTNSLIDKFTPKIKEEKTEWTCTYCNGINDPESNKCEFCGAAKKTTR